MEPNQRDSLEGSWGKKTYKTQKKKKKKELQITESDQKDGFSQWEVHIKKEHYHSKNILT